LKEIYKKVKKKMNQKSLPKRFIRELHRQAPELAQAKFERLIIRAILDNPETKRKIVFICFI